MRLRSKEPTMPVNIHLPHIADGSIDLGGQRIEVIDHIVTVPDAAVGTVLRQNEGAEIVPGEEQ